MNHFKEAKALIRGEGWCMYCSKLVHETEVHDCPKAPEKETFQKYDGGKPRFDLFDPVFLEEVAMVLEYGAHKYEDNNWRRGAAYGRYFAAGCRHMWAFWRGEQRDPETKLHHLAHATCCIMFLFAYDVQKIGIDNRPYTKTEGDQ